VAVAVRLVGVVSYIDAPPGDAIAHLDRQLARARERAAKALDGVEALAEIRSLAVEARARSGRSVFTLTDFQDAPRSEEERARLHSLFARAAGTA
jgi:hypothetical protein